MILLMHGTVHAEWFVAAALVSSWVVTGSLFSGQARTKKSGLFLSSLVLFFGFLLMLAFVLIHADKKIFSVMAAAASVCAIIACINMFRPLQKKNNFSKTFTFCIAIAGFAIMAGVSPALYLYHADVSTPEKNEIKVLTYNIHMGFDADLVMDLEHIAETIQAINPDIIGLQEVNRAQAANGMTDTLTYLLKRLNYPYYCYGGNHGDKQFGNAILSRYPIAEWTNTVFTVNGPDQRGFLRATCDINGKKLNLYVTHLDYVYGEKNKRLPQVRQIVAAWNGAPHSIIMGDLNADTNTPEMAVLYNEKKLFDVLASKNKKYEKTFYAGWGDPALKLDYLFATPDITAVDAMITETRASDHKPVHAVIVAH